MLSNATILVVGADAHNREKVFEALGGECHVVAAQNSDDALAHQNNHVDLIIVENSVVGDANFFQRWRRRNTQTPIVAIVNGNDVRQAVDAMKSGAADCLVKPLDPDDVRALVTHILNAGPSSGVRSGNGDVGKEVGRRANIDIPPDTSLEDLERAAVEQALVQHNGNRTHAARTLGISVRTLQRKLKAWGMPIVSFPAAATNTNFTLPGTSGPAHSFNVHAH
jgi:DNA-binding NtrC family response regulator